MISADVTFLENNPFSLDPIRTSLGEDDDLLVYALASSAPASVTPLTKPPITQSLCSAPTPPSLEPSIGCFDIRFSS